MATPVKVKYYRVFNLTRKLYLILQSAAFVVLVIILILCFTLFPPSAREGLFILEHIEWLAGLALVLEIVETSLMLRKFRIAEAEAATEGPLQSSRGAGNA